MNYPVWQVNWLGGGTIIAVISILHVYIAHLAVGGGMYIWLTDCKAVRENSVDLRNFIKKHVWFFLLVTMVFGAVTGVGIWFSISLVNPAGTSALIHYFVFAWAIEWTFFLGEIVALLVYHYRFDALKEQDRNRVAFLYFIFAWLSLFAINGILSFMLTPGKWTATMNFWHGFFNPSFFPTLFFRTFLSAMFAGIFSYVTALFGGAVPLRKNLLDYSRKWVQYSALGMLPFLVWSYFSVPAPLRETSFYLNPQTSPFIVFFFIALFVALVLPFYINASNNLRYQKSMAAVIAAAGLFIMGSFEYLREITRKPFVIRDYLYSSSIYAGDVGKILEEGFLPRARWSPLREITAENEIAAGREIFNLQCLSCHTIRGIRNDIAPRTAGFTYDGLLAQLDGQGRVLDYMPPFMGTDDEKRALALYLYREINGKEMPGEPQQPLQPGPGKALPQFKANSEYVLLAWPERGISLLSDCDRWFTLFPPDTTMKALLIKRGANPQVVTEEALLRYEIENDFQHPSRHIPFWDHAESTMKVSVKKDQGITGNYLTGSFVYDDRRGTLAAVSLPLAPYGDSGAYDPYPVFTIESGIHNSAREVLKTVSVAAVSAEPGCANCHEGGWKHEASRAGISDGTAINILRAHDRISRTGLFSDARSGNPRSCASCHEDALSGSAGDGKRMNLSASIHGFHAGYIKQKDSGACLKCHPSSTVTGTMSSRGIHETVGMTCVECHGTMDQHALALLKHESAKKTSARLAGALKKESSVPFDRIEPRKPWLQEPDCLTCHVNFDAPTNYEAFNRWNAGPSGLFKNNTDNVGVPCQACHGPAHALYPVDGPSASSGNAQPVQYTGSPYPLGADRKCGVCHKKGMNDSLHHDNMLRMFRNR
ncbi:MAG TPA: c-type cytochrome [Spirochaetota bacterium]|nr:c-type cytochrome [Spirochaetota bacterium]